MTPRRRRVGLIVFLALTAFLAVALAIGRYYFSGPRLAHFLVSVLFSNIRGRVEIDSADWDFLDITSRQLPATIRGLRIYAPDRKTIVLTATKATAIIDWPTVVFGRHDAMISNLVVYDGFALVRQDPVANPAPGEKLYEVGFVAALQGKPRPGDPQGPGSPGPIVEAKTLTMVNTQVHLEFVNWNAHVYGVSAKGVLRQSFRRPELIQPDFTFMLDDVVAEAGSVEFAKQHFDLVKIRANRFGQYPYDQHSLAFSATASSIEGARMQIAGKLGEIYDPDPRKSTVDLRIDAHDGGELLRRLSFGILAGRPSGTIEIHGPMVAPQLVAEGRAIELVSSVPVTFDHVAVAMDIAMGEIAVAEIEASTLRGRIEAKGRGNLTANVISSATITVTEPLHLAPYLPVWAEREAGSLLTGRADFSAVPPAITATRLNLTLGKATVSGSARMIGDLIYSSGVTVTLGDDVRAEVAGRVSPKARTLDLSGKLRAENVAPILARFGLPDLAHAVDVPAVRVSGSLDAPTVTARATANGAPMTPKIETELIYQHARGGGRLDVRRLVADTLGGSVHGRGVVVLGARPRLEGVEVDASGVDLATIPGTDRMLAGRGQLSLRASGSLTAPRGKLDATLTGLRFDDKVVGDARVRARADDRGVIFEELHVGDAAGRLDVTGSVGWPNVGAAYRLDLHVVLDGLWLGLIPEPTRSDDTVGGAVASASAAPPTRPLNLDGRVNADLRIGGTTSRPSATGRARLVGIAIYDAVLGSGDLNFTSRSDGRVGFAGRLFQDKLGLEGSVALGGPTGVDARARVTLNKVELEELVHDLAARVGAHGWASGTIDVRTSPTISAEAHLDRVRFDFDGFDAEGRPNPITVENKGEIAAAADASRMEIRLLSPLRLVSQSGEFTIEGMASEARLAMTLRGDVQLRLLELFTRRFIDQARGALTVDVALGGSAERPTLDGQIGFRDAAVRPRDQESEVLVPGGALVFSLNQLSAQGIVLEIDGQKLNIDGAVTLKALRPDTVNARVEGRLAGKLLEMIAPKELTHAAGSAAVSLAIQGPFDKPAMQGQVTFDQRLEIAPRALRRELALSTGRVRFNNRQVLIENVTGQVDEGRIAISGFATLLPQLAVFAHVNVDEVTHREPGVLEIELNASLDMTYRNQGLAVKGDIDIVDGRYVQQVHLDRFATDFIAPDRTTEVAEPFWKGSPLLANMELNLQVRTTGAFLVSNELANVTLDGSVEITGTPPRPVFNGQVTAVGEGTLTIPGIKIREFLVSEGNVRFSKYLEFPKRTPTVLLKADAPFTDYSGTEHRVYLQIDGTLSGFTWKLWTSTGLNQTQTLSLISTGRTPEELLGRTRGDATSASDNATAGQYGLATQSSATDEVLKSFSGDIIDTLIADAVRNLIGLDCFSLSVGASSVRASACKKLGQLVTLTGEYEQGLGFVRYEGNFSLRPTDDVAFVLQGWGLRTAQEVEGVLNSLRLQLEYRFTLR